MSTQVLIAPDYEVWGNVNQLNLPPYWSRAKNQGSDNPGSVYIDTPRPSNVSRDYFRHTVAIDAIFHAGYLDTDAAHFGVVSGGAASYYSPRDLSGLAVIAGNYGQGVRSVGAEGIQLHPQVPAGNVHPYTAAGVIQHDQWYRFVVDAICMNGAVAIEIRARNVQTSELVADSGTHWLMSPWLFDRDKQRVVLFSIPMGNQAALIRVKNAVCYWTAADAWVPNP